MKVNTNEYWENRFKTFDWRSRMGPKQTNVHAKHYVKHLNISRYFSGSILDFGCAEGDAFPIYKKCFPKAKLIGLDFSITAIKFAKEKYGDIAEFICGSIDDVPVSDIIISSHVFEHIENEESYLNALLNKCRKLFIIVPYKEELGFIEHFRSYDENAYYNWNPKRFVIMKAGFNLSFIDIIFNIYIKDIFRPFFGRKIQREPKQIMFEFEGNIKYSPMRFDS